MIKEGKNPADIGKTFKELREEARVEAEKAVKAQILLMKISEKEGIEVTDEEMDRQMRSFAVRSGQEAKALREEYERTGMMGNLRHRVLTDKTLKAVYDKAKVVMIPPLAPEGGQAADGAEPAPAAEAAPEAPKAAETAPADEAPKAAEAPAAEESPAKEEKPRRGRSKTQA